jgi:hypothetical protein
MTQRDLFGDPRENRRLEVQGELHTLLRQLAPHYSETRATVHVERCELGPSEQVTARVWLDGRPYAVVNRADVVSAARDLWEMARPGGGLR